jgi:indole-3-glycerol phosphate synthase
VDGSRRLSQAISEGDGISVLVHVGSLDAARAAEAQGAEGIVLDGPAEGVRTATTLPILYRAGGSPDAARDAGADAWLLVIEEVGGEPDEIAAAHARAGELGLECVVDVRDDEELERALEHLDPEIFLLSSRAAEDDESPLDRVLELLPDVPAGKLAIAELQAATRDDVVALERAGVDGVLVPGGDVAGLVGGAPPEV